jgi:hypothetical protein
MKAGSKKVKTTPLPPPTRGRAKGEHLECLSIASTRRGDQHNLMDCGLLGDPSTKQMKCAYCLFDVNYSLFSLW